MFNILIVDDDLIWLDLLKDVSRYNKYPFNFTGVDNHQEAIAILDHPKTDFDLVLFDRELTIDDKFMYEGISLFSRYHKSFKCKVISSHEMENIELVAVPVDDRIMKSTAEVMLAHITNYFIQNGSDTAQFPEIGVTIMSEPLNNKVLVVYGNCLKPRESLFKLLDLAGVEPMEWEQLVHETGLPSPSTFHVLTTAFNVVQAVVVLMYPEENVQLIEDLGGHSQGTQSRPNVIFEAGMALGIYPDRVILVQVKNSRVWSDIDGINRVVMDGSYSARNALLQRLKLAKCKVREGSTRFFETPLDWDC